jgi:Response regulators consisting of a CheY-like receiver domain and a winged-helix DNA-binding domain
MKNKILVVDDDVAICELLTDVLCEHVFDVRTCHLAQSALQTLQQEPDIALVLLDLMLPDMSGLLLLQQIRLQFPDLPVIMLTGLATESDMIVGLEMGADDYIAKPFVPRIVVARVKAVLRRTPVGETPQRRVMVPISGPGYRFDGWLLNTHTGRLHTPDGDDIELTQGEYSLLTVLLKNAQSADPRSTAGDDAQRRAGCVRPHHRCVDHAPAPENRTQPETAGIYPHHPWCRLRHVA